MSGKSRAYYHEQGQKDRSRGNGHNRPHGFFDQVTTWSHSGERKLREHNRAYDKGWKNAGR